MKEIVDALNTRIKSPVFGYYILFAFFFNWKPIFYILASDTIVKDRFTYFEGETSFNSLFIYPIILAIIYTIVYPWINYLFSYLTSKPFEKKQTLQTIIEHNILIKKQELEKVRLELNEIQERKLIDRTKRDQEIQNIEDEDLRIKLKNEINLLRNEYQNSKDQRDHKIEKLTEHIKDLENKLGPKTYFTG